MKTAKLYSRIITLCLALSLSACGQSPKGDALPSDAQVVLDSVLADFFPARGESRFSKIQYELGGRGENGQVPYLTISEWKSPHLNIVHIGKDKLKEADIANGTLEYWAVTWTSTISRHFFFYLASDDDGKEYFKAQSQKWTSWSDVFPTPDQGGPRLDTPPSLQPFLIVRKSGAMHFELQRKRSGFFGSYNKAWGKDNVGLDELPK